LQSGFGSQQTDTMPTYSYQAFSKSGELAKGTIEAPSSAGADAMLRNRGLTPFETRERLHEKRTWWTYEPASAGAPNPLEVATFAHDLALLVDTEVPLDRALRLMASQAPPRAKRVAEALLQGILDGSSLSDACARNPRTFSSEFVNAVRAGEVSGRLGDALERLADLLKRRQERRARVRTALIYPILLLVMALVSTAIVLVLLVPGIAPIFTDSGQPMPAGLQLLVDIGNAWPIWCAALASLVSGIGVYLRWMAQKAQRAVPMHKLLLRLPLVGPLLQKNEAARFARTLATLLGAGVPLLVSLSAAMDGLSNAAMRVGLSRVVDQVRNGTSLSEAVDQSGAMPALLVQMLGIGEEAGKPQVMLARVADLYEKQTQDAIERLMSILTPALTIAIAALVGGLIFAVMNAVLAINDLAVK
jgi:general secretion pathway protein F